MVVEVAGLGGRGRPQTEFGRGLNEIRAGVSFSVIMSFTKIMGC